MKITAFSLGFRPAFRAILSARNTSPMPSPINPSAPISKKLRRETGPRHRVKKEERDSCMGARLVEAPRGEILSRNDGVAVASGSSHTPGNPGGGTAGAGATAYSPYPWSEQYR